MESPRTKGFFRGRSLISMVHFAASHVWVPECKWLSSISSVVSSIYWWLNSYHFPWRWRVTYGTPKGPFTSSKTDTERCAKWSQLVYGRRNPALVDRWFILVFIWFQPSKMMQDFFQPQYFRVAIRRIPSVLLGNQWKSSINRDLNGQIIWDGGCPIAIFDYIKSNTYGAHVFPPFFNTASLSSKSQSHQAGRSCQAA